YCLPHDRHQTARGPRLPGVTPADLVLPPRRRPMSDATAAVHAVPGHAPVLPMRPREKLRHRGPAALTDAELLALLVGSGTAGRSAMRIASSVARRHPAEVA